NQRYNSREGRLRNERRQDRETVKSLHSSLYRFYLFSGESSMADVPAPRKHSKRPVRAALCRRPGLASRELLSGEVRPSKYDQCLCKHISDWLIISCCDCGRRTR